MIQNNTLPFKKFIHHVEIILDWQNIFVSQKASFDPGTLTVATFQKKCLWIFHLINRKQKDHKSPVTLL